MPRKPLIQIWPMQIRLTQFRRLRFFFLAWVMVLDTGFRFNPPPHNVDNATPVKARPVMVGDKIPSIKVKTIDGQDVSLDSIIDGKMTLLAFTTQVTTSDASTQRYFRTLRPYIEGLGYQIVIVAPVSPAVIRSTTNSYHNRVLLSDESREAFIDMGLADTSNHIDPITNGIFLVAPNHEILFEFASLRNSIPVSGEVLVLAAKVYRDLANTFDKAKK